MHSGDTKLAAHARPGRTLSVSVKQEEESAAVVAVRPTEASPTSASATTTSASTKLRDADLGILNLSDPEVLDDDAVGGRLRTSMMLSAKQLDVGRAIFRQGTREPIFTVAKYLAQGAYGEIYRVSHVETQRHYALKRIRFALLRESSQRRDSEKAHLEEASIMLSLGRHRNVMSMTYCVIDDSEFLMVLEFVEDAADLRILIKNGSLYAKEKTGDKTRAYVLELLRQAAAGIAFVNEHSILHQDVRSSPLHAMMPHAHDLSALKLLLLLRPHFSQVKPDNLMVGKCGILKLVDFGLATRGEGSGTTLRASYQGCTPGYDSPQVRACAPGGKLGVCEHDLWAWACSSLDVLTASDSSKSLSEIPTSKLEQMTEQPQSEWDWSQVEMWANKVHPDVANALLEKGVKDGRALRALPPTTSEGKRLGITKLAVRKKLQARRLDIAPLACLGTP